MLAIVAFSGCIAEESLLAIRDAAIPDSGPSDTGSALDAGNDAGRTCLDAAEDDDDGDGIPNYRDPFPSECQLPVFDSSISRDWMTGGDYELNGQEVSGRNGNAVHQTEGFELFITEATITFEDEGDEEWLGDLEVFYGSDRAFDASCSIRSDRNLNAEQGPDEVLIFTGVRTRDGENSVFPVAREPRSTQLTLQLVQLNDSSVCRVFDDNSLVGTSSLIHQTRFPTDGVAIRVASEGRRMTVQSVSSYVR